MYLKATKFREQVWLRYILIVNVKFKNKIDVFNFQVI